MKPYRAEVLSSSTGPNEATPIAASVPSGLTPLSQEGLRDRERRGWISGGETLVRQDFAAVVADGHHELGASGFDTTKNARHTGHGSQAYRICTSEQPAMSGTARRERNSSI